MHGWLHAQSRFSHLVLMAILIGSFAPGIGAASAAESDLVPASVQSGLVSLVDINRIPGVEQAVGRSFDSRDSSQTGGVGHLEFGVLAFTDAEATQAALPEVFPAISSVVRQDAQSSTAARLGDETLAWTATGPSKLSVAILIIMDDTYIHVLIAVAESGDPLDTLTSIAERTIGQVLKATPADVATATPVASPADSQARPLTSGGLWDLLPGYQDLPGEFGLYTEESWPGPGDEIAGVPPPADPADCQGEPRPRSDFEALISASPSAIGRSELSGTPLPTATPLTGEPADEETVDGVMTAVQQFNACIAVNDWPRVYTSFTDRLFAEALAGVSPEFLDVIFSGRTELPVADGPRLVDVRNVQILADGRIGAEVEIVTVIGDMLTRDTEFMWFVRDDDRFLIDEIAPISRSEETIPEGD